jgi:hypothetical protein
LAIYCDLDIRRKIEAFNHHRINVRLLLRNPSNEIVRIKWEVTVPPVFDVVHPAMPMKGEDTLQPGIEETVAGWTIDISKLPEPTRATIIRNNPIVANLSEVWIGISLLGDICSRRLWQSDSGN